jgi:Rap1a immunity proteins
MEATMLTKSVLIMLLIAGTPPAAAQADDLLTADGAVSAKGLAQYCASDKTEELYFCAGYMAASINNMGISGDLMRAGDDIRINVMAICPKDSANVAKNITEFVTWMQSATPEQRDGRAAIAMVEFLKAKYPCP